jgi:Endonuclease V (EC 3.1.21.-)
MLFYSILTVLAHPRRFGLASHLGVLFDVPSIGISDRILVGLHDDMDSEKGHHAPLIHNDKEVGLALRTKDGVNPVFVSVGHKADLLTTNGVYTGMRNPLSAARTHPSGPLGRGSPAGWRKHRY